MLKTVIDGKTQDYFPFLTVLFNFSSPDGFCLLCQYGFTVEGFRTGKQKRLRQEEQQNLHQKVCLLHVSLATNHKFVYCLRERLRIDRHRVILAYQLQTIKSLIYEVALIKI